MQFSFSVPVSEYGSDTSGSFPSGAVVRLKCSNVLMSIPDFYIVSRSYSGAAVNFVCYDKTYTVDRDILLTDDMFDSDGYISISSLLSHIASICGFECCTDSSGILGSIITVAHKDHVQGVKCRAVLEDLAKACAGFWVSQGDAEGSLGRLTLIDLGGSSFGSYPADKGTYEKIYYGAATRFPKIVLTNGNLSYTAGTNADVQGILEIDTPYASANLAGALYERLKDFTYQAWECGMMLTDVFIRPSALITFGSNDELYVNHCSMMLTRTGIYASVGRNAVSEDEIKYINRTTREMRRRYRLGDVMSNVQISRNGINYIFRDEINNKTEKYGFKVNSGGVTEYEGTMLSAMQPSGKFISSENGTIFRGTVGGKEYDWGCTEAEDGTLSLYRNEVISDG